MALGKDTEDRDFKGNVLMDWHRVIVLLNDVS